MSTTPATVLITFHPADGHHDTVRDSLTRALTRADDPALLGGQVLTDDTDQTVVYALQTWTDAAAFRAHITAAGGFDPMAPLLTGPPRVQTLTTHTSR